jgi:hypothetical protein
MAEVGTQDSNFRFRRQTPTGQGECQCRWTKQTSVQHTTEHANTTTVMMMSLVDNDSGITPAAATTATSMITSATTPTTPSEVTSMATSSTPSTAEDNGALVIDMATDDPILGESDGTQICTACKKSNPEEELLQCTGCNKRISCLQPSVYEELDEWTCHDCGGEMKSITDITLDQPVRTFCGIPRCQWTAHQRRCFGYARGPRATNFGTANSTRTRTANIMKGSCRQSWSEQP